MAPKTQPSKNSWEGVTDLAQKAGAKFPELVAAQWALESGHGEHTSGKNNFFGLKGGGTNCTTQEYEHGVPVTIVDGFLNFNSIDDCIKYLVSRWYLDFGGFKGVNHASSRGAAARELQNQGYATNPAYADRLIKLMNEKAGPSKPASQGSKPQEAKPLFGIEAVVDTVLKKQPLQASELEAKELLEVPKGKAYSVTRYTERAADAHAQVELAYGAGTWFIFEPHWRKTGLGGEALLSEVDWNDFNCMVTPHLTVGDILQFDKRRTPAANSAVKPRLLRTALEYEKVRGAWGRGLGVTSFYRPEPINTEVGGDPGSRHVCGDAMDIYPTDRSLESFYQWIRVRWKGGLGDGRARGFIHLDMLGGGFVPGGGVAPMRTWLY